MNLHAVVSGAINAINPQILGTVRMSTGSTTLQDGSRVPRYTDFANVPMQVQSLQYSDLLKLAGMNIQGVRNKIYLSGDWNGLVRRDGKGGDVIVIANGPSAGTWLVALVLESWPDWTCAAVTMQVA